MVLPDAACCGPCRCVEAHLPQGFEIVAGVSRHHASWMDVGHTMTALNYSPQDGTAFVALPAKL